MNLTINQILILAGVFVIGWLLITLARAIARRFQKRSLYARIYWNRQEWLLPRRTFEGVMRHLKPLPRWFIQRTSNALLANKTVLFYTLYVALLGRAMNAYIEEAPASAGEFTEVGQAQMREHLARIEQRDRR